VINDKKTRHWEGSEIKRKGRRTTKEKGVRDNKVKILKEILRNVT